MKKTLRELKKDYEEFITNIPDYLDKIKLILNVEKLSFDFDEIGRVYDIYRHYFNTPETLQLTYFELEQVLYAYFGEAFKHHQGGEWSLSTTKSDEAYGSPIIINWGGEDYPWSRISPKVWKIRLEKGMLGSAKKLFG